MKKLLLALMLLIAMTVFSEEANPIKTYHIEILIIDGLTYNAEELLGFEPVLEIYEGEIAVLTNGQTFAYKFVFGSDVENRDANYWYQVYQMKGLFYNPKVVRLLNALIENSEPCRSFVRIEKIPLINRVYKLYLRTTGLMDSQ